MSLSLIQGYSSGEEEEDHKHHHIHNSSSDDDDADADAGQPSVAAHPSLGDRSIFDLPQPSSASALPSAFDAFSEISGPPQFLNNSVEDYNPARDTDQQQQGRHRNKRHRKDKKDLPTGAVVEAKAQLVGIHERVRSDINGSQPPTSAALSTSEGVKRVPTATNPNAEDAAELLSAACSLYIKLLCKFIVGLEQIWRSLKSNVLAMWDSQDLLQCTWNGLPCMW